MRQIVRMALMVLIAGLTSALLVRYSPGSLVDERELDQRISSENLAALRAENAAKRSVAKVVLNNLRGFIHGDLGYSESQHAPISQLIAERGPVTLRYLAGGLLGGWLIGLACAIPAGRFQHARAYDVSSTAVAGFLLSVPAALLAYLCLDRGFSVAAVLVLVLAPRIFRFARNLIVQAYTAAHVDMARSLGLGESRILATYVLPSIAPQLIALGGASMSIAIGAAIPIETICDVPGVGHLALQAAMARDLPVLVNLTMLVALVTTATAGVSELLGKAR